MEINKSMKVFSQLYVGLRNGTNRLTTKLGFATPFEKNAAFEKRKITVDNWSDNNIEKLLIDNVPREGFKLTDDVKRRYWGGGNVVFRVEDPAGFELEISSENLMALIEYAGINAGGLIPGKCMWGRSGANNILLHESSEEFKNAILNFETVKKPSIMTLKDREVGAHYVLQNGENCIYLGKVYASNFDGSDHRDNWCGSGIIENAKTPNNIPVRVAFKKHGVTIKNLEDVYDAVVIMYDDSNIKRGVKLYKKAPLIKRLDKPVEPQEFVDKKLLSKASFAASSNYYSNLVSKNKDANFVFIINPLTKEEFDIQIKNVDAQAYYNRFERFFSTYNQSNARFYDLLIKDGDDFYSCVGNHYHRNTIDVGNVKHVLTTVSVVGNTYNMHSLCTNSLVYGSQFKSSSVKCKSFPFFETVAEYQKWFTEQFEAGNLFKVEIIEQ